MEYKIEKKPNMWVVYRRRGRYSDREEEFDVVAANSPEEAWTFITAYWKDLYDKNINKSYYGCTNANYGELIFNIPGTTPSWDDPWECKIYMLPVIHVHSL